MSKIVDFERKLNINLVMIKIMIMTVLMLENNPNLKVSAAILGTKITDKT